MEKIRYRADPGKKDFTFEMKLQAPPEKIYRILTDPELIPTWWGPREMRTEVEKMDVRPGGKWRFRHYDPDGNEYAFNGVYIEVMSPMRLAYTFEFEGMPGHVMTERVLIEPEDDRTLLTITDEFESSEERDAALESGMKEGAMESMERFQAVLYDMARK